VFKGIIELTYASAERVSAELHSSSNLNDETKAERYSYEFPEIEEIAAHHNIAKCIKPPNNLF
jgi:hypothetical protein